MVVTSPPGDGAALVGYIFPHQSSIKTMSNRRDHRVLRAKQELGI